MTIASQALFVKPDNQFPEVTIMETGKVLTTSNPDEFVFVGTLPGGAVATAHFEGGKRNSSGVQIDFTGTEGDIRITNSAAFGGPGDDYVMTGARGDKLRAPPRSQTFQRHLAMASMVMRVSTGAFFDGGLSELFEGVPVPVPVRYSGEREPELEEAGAIGQISRPAEPRAGFRPTPAVRVTVQNPPKPTVICGMSAERWMLIQSLRPMSIYSAFVRLIRKRHYLETS